MFTYTAAIDERASLTGAGTTFRLLGYARDAMERIGQDIAAIEQLDRPPLVTEVRDAILTPMAAASANTFSGGVFGSDGRPVPSARIERHEEGVVFCGDDAPGPAGAPDRELAQAWYAGALFSGYGHVILESMARLTAEMAASPLPIVMHAAAVHLDKLDLLHSVLALLSIDRERLRFVDRPLKVGRLLVPEAGFVIGERHNLAHIRWLHENVRAALPHLGGAAGPPIMLSRSALPSARRRAFGEAAVEGWLEQSCRIVHPEKLGFTEQVSLVNEADRFLGLLGSQMHNLLFRARREPPEILYLSPGRPLRAYLQIDLLFGGGRTYVNSARFGDAFQFGGASPCVLDLDLVRQGLLVSGFPVACAAPAAAGEQDETLKAFYAAWTEGFIEMKLIKISRYWNEEDGPSRLSKAIDGYQPRLAKLMSIERVAPVVRAAAEATLDRRRNRLPAGWREQILQEAFAVPAAAG